MRTMSEIERRVNSEVCRVVANVMNWPKPVGAQMLGRDLAEPIDKIVEALLPIIQEAKSSAWKQGFLEGDSAAYHGYMNGTPKNPYEDES